MKNLVEIFPVLVPSPGFGYVIVVFEANDQLVFVAGLGGRKISSINERKNQFLQFTRAWNRFHPWLIVRRTVVHEGNRVPV